MKPRTSYTKKEKMKALYAYASGKKSQEALYLINPDAINPTIKDERHAVKLLNKWKQDLYSIKDFSTNINQNCNDIYFNSDNNTKITDTISNKILSLDEISKNESNQNEKLSFAKEIEIAKRYIRKLKKAQKDSKEK